MKYTNFAPDAVSRFDLRNVKGAKTELAEVLDQDSRPLCLMPPADVARLSLPHKSVALLVSDKRGRLILRLNSKKEFGFVASGFLPAGEAPEDRARALLPEWARDAREWREALVFPPSSETRFALLWVFEARRVFCPEDENLLPLFRSDYAALLSRGYSFCPVFNFVVQSGKYDWS